MPLDEAAARRQYGAVRWLNPVSVGVSVFAIMAVALGCALLPSLAPETLFAPVAKFSLHSLCHQRPERSFQFGGHAMALCHRCTGLYAGVGLGALLAALGVRVNPRNRRAWIGFAGFMLAQVCAGWATDALDLWPLRSLTGVLLGGWLGLCLASAFARRVSQTASSPRSTSAMSSSASSRPTA
ncbi:MAG: DUF2085 domain-containing protein [Sandaracinaceae bacterium]